ncbi:MAG TPA: hypothetical protein VGS80_21635, partial [Ktedonobacterales bacterium]|nr:hypothetical protein [Ktedonobacterales bacterium]
LLLERCRSDQQRIMAGRACSIAGLFAEERPQLGVAPLSWTGERVGLPRYRGRVKESGDGRQVLEGQR